MFTFAGDAQLENLILKESALVSVFYSFKYSWLFFPAHFNCRY